MKQTMDKLLERYGGELTLASGRRFRGFLQPLLSRQEGTLHMSPLGPADIGSYLFIGPESCPVQAGDTVLFQGSRYLFAQVRPVSFGPQTLYFWGICRKEENYDL